MRKERVEVAHNVAAHLADAERTNDLAIVATARLAISMLEGRMTINAAACVGQPAFATVAATFQQQSAIRQQLIEAHEALNDTKTMIGLRELAIGGLGNKEVDPKENGALKLVESQAA